jgi:hypothetical protein
METSVPFQPLLPFDAPAEPSREPAPAPATARVIEELARICRERPLEEKVLVSPSLAIGHTLAERLAREGRDWTNLRVETVRTLAAAAVGPQLARGGWKILSRAQTLALVEQACAQSAGPGGYFGSIADRPGLHRALQETLEELRAAGLSADTLPRRAFTDGRKHHELTGILRRYTTALREGKSVDGIEVLRRAIDAADRPARAGEGALYLVVAADELSALERALLDRLAGTRQVSLAGDAPQDWARIAPTASIFRAVGEENEIREAFRRVLAAGAAWDDVELLHTDSNVYPALIYELGRELEIPCTFAGGIAATYTHPGRAALAFLDWIGRGFEAEVLRSALASGTLTFSRMGVSPSQAGARAAARAVREAGIGWGRDRHLTRLDDLVAELEQQETWTSADADRSEEERAARIRSRERRLEAGRRARDFVRRVVSLVPNGISPGNPLPQLAAATRSFVAAFARVADSVDATARSAIDALLKEFEDLEALPTEPAAAVERLRDAVSRLSIGFSGRRRTFLLGLDEGRMPGRDLEDPVLSDEERRRINEERPDAPLPLGRDRPRDATRALRACVSRLRGRLTASYSSFDLRNLSQAGEPSASPFLLDLYRQSSGEPGADYARLAASLPDAHGFIPKAEDALDDTEWWLARLRGRAAAASADAQGLVRGFYPWLADGRAAVTARASGEFTIWDGWIPSGTPELDPRNARSPISASRIQELAKCPFAYFVKRVLRVEPPEETESDPTRWLDPMGEGSLLHEVFRDFFERIGEAGQKPNASLHAELILEVAEERIAAWRERIAPRSELAFSVQRENILFACRTLLTLEEESCRDVSPRFHEIPFGLPRQRTRAGTPSSAEPVEIEAAPNARFLLRGSIDRVDEAADGSFHVWDYKTGGAWGVREGMGLKGGRHIQPALYAFAFEALLTRAGKTGRVSRSGYVYPGWKGEGQRFLTRLDRQETRDVLGRLFDLLAQGKFPHALSADDCKNCDFESVCGGARWAAERAYEKLANTADPVLAAFRDLHVEEPD